MNSNWICAALFTILIVAGLAWGEAKPKATSAQATNSGNAPVTLSSAAPASVGFDQSRLALLNSAMHRLVDGGEAAGVMTMLVRHGMIVNCDAYGKDSISKGTPLSRDRIFRLFSQTKPVTGIAMMILYEQGKWRLEDPVSKYIPEFKNLKVFAGLDKDGKPILEEPKQPPTMAMLMTHSAGFGYGLENVSYADYVDQQFQKQGVLRSNSLPEAVTKIAGIPLLYQPGTHWWYSAAADIQGDIVEKLSGQRFGDFLAQHVFTPLGMKDTGFYVTGDKAARLASVYQFNPDKKLIELTASTNPQARDFTKQPSMDSGGGGDGGGGGGLLTTIDDFARFCQMILNSGIYDGVRILAPESVALMLADHLPATVLPPESGSGLPPIGSPALGFGLDFGVIRNPALVGWPAAPGSVFWAGGGGTWFWIDPKNDLFFLGMMQLQGGDVTALNMMSQTLVYAALGEPNK